LSKRKGIRQFSEALRGWCDRHPAKPVTLAIAGDGPLKEDLIGFEGDSLSLDFLGNCNTSELADAYRDSDAAVFPSLADEWGLVPVEAMASGVPVLGSFFAQSVEATGEEGKNGWLFDPTNRCDVDAAIDRCMACSDEQLIEMGHYARASVAHITPERTADCFCEIIRTALPDRFATLNDTFLLIQPCPRNR
jgi:glycosyltransferase involved in cell wall biosynthesis